MSDLDPRWLSSTQLSAWLPLGAVLLSLPSALDAQLQRDAGLSYFSYLVLAGLSESPQRTLRMSDLAALASGSLSRLSHTVRKLEQEGWVQRRPCPEDGRITLATLTDAGMAKVIDTAPGHVAAVRRYVVDVLTDDELHTVGRAARTILAAVLGRDDAILIALDGRTTR
jgi:DNA-binding MarR family transcriptional regulator